MKYEIKYISPNKETGPSKYMIICQDSEAKAFMKAINKEIKLMETGRKREMREGVKEAVRTMPHKHMKKEKNKFYFDNFNVDDVCTAARRLIGQKTRSSFFGPFLIITLEFIENFENALEMQKEKQ